MKNKRLVTLIIMDGVGMPRDLSVSAVLPETTPYLQELAQKYKRGILQASGRAVGLPDDQFGTSEVGHAAIGSGRVNYQSIVRINDAIKSGEFEHNPAIVAAIENAKKKDKALHLIGIVSDGGVHSHIDHLIELIRIASVNELKKVYIHFITDGRDTPPKSAKKYLRIVQNAIKKYKTGQICDICGRLYALDRDNNWDRVQVFYDAVVSGVGESCDDIESGLKAAYARGEKDEFIKPVLYKPNGIYEGKINRGDSVIIYNFRVDRERQLARVLSNDNQFDWTKKLDLTLVTMTNYDGSLGGVKVAFETEQPRKILSEVLSERGYRQLKVAETEKYVHVTYFFNSGADDAFKNEDRVLIASEKLVSYDVNPKMSAEKIAQTVIKGIKDDKYDVIVINFANGDMVGHSGNLEAAKIAVSVVDECVKKVTEAVLAKGGVAIVTADHGNADIMVYPDGTPHKSHTMSVVPIIIAGRGFEAKSAEISGNLSDIAPTILHILDEPIPKEMTGKVLV